MSSPSSLPSGQGFIPQYTTVSRAVKGRNAGIAVVLVGFVGGVYAWTYQKMRTVSAALRGRSLAGPRTFESRVHVLRL
jgi:hypothetical protein